MVFIKFHNECNNNCVSCRSREWNKIEFSDIKNEVMEKLKPGVVFEFIGGEPFIKEDIFNLLGIVKNNLNRYRFYSNGRLFFYKDFVEKCHDYLGSVVVTFFGNTKEKHDKFTRVNGSFDQAFDGLKNLIYFDVKVVCNLYNCGEEFAKKLIDFGVSEIYITEDGDGEEFVYSCFSDKVKQVKYEFNRISIPIVFDKVNDFNLDLFNLLIGLKFYLNKDKSKKDQAKVPDEPTRCDQNELIRKDVLTRELKSNNLSLSRPLSNLNITICNVLNSKGLSADVVFLIGFDQGRFPLKTEVSDSEVYQMLVALTRAKKRVYLINTIDRKVSDFSNCMTKDEWNIETVDTIKND